MRIVIPGGSGHLGTMLARALHADGHEVVVLSRRASSAQPWTTSAWDGRTLGAWATAVDGADAVINLAGRSVNCRYTAANRAEIIASRVDSTRVVGQAIAACRRPPRVWLQMSTATIYAHRFDAANDDVDGIVGGDERDLPDAWRFSLDVARRWEQTCAEAPLTATRRVILRCAMVMSPEPGGPFAVMLGLVRKGLGGRAADGRQYMSWIHGRDFVRAISWLIAHDQISGVVTIAAPDPRPNADFMRTLRQAAGVRFGLPAARWMLALGALAMRTETELILKSRRVMPRRLTDSGFSFTFGTWAEAARDLCSSHAASSP